MNKGLGYPSTVHANLHACIYMHMRHHFVVTDEDTDIYKLIGFSLDFILDTLHLNILKIN